MKHFWRIAITIVVLVAVGFTSYFLFFKPDSDLETFTKLSNTINKRDSLGVDTNLKELYDFDGHGTKYIRYHKVKSYTGEDPAPITIDNNKYDYKESDINYQSEEKNFFEFNKSDYSDIVNYREMLFYYGVPSNNSGFNTYKYTDDNQGSFYSYTAIEYSLDNIFNYYFAYAQVMDDVKNSDQKAMNKTIKSYNNALSEFNSQINSVLNYQKAYTFDETNGKSNFEVVNKDNLIVKEIKEYDYNSNLSGKIELTSRYLKLIESYRNLLSKKCDLIEQLKSMVIKYVFDGELIIETSTVKNDLTVMLVKASFDKEYNKDTEPSSLRNITQFVDICMGVGPFKNNTDADTVLEKYNNVINNAKGDLKTTLSLTNSQLNYLADNKLESDTGLKEIASKFNQKYIKDIQAILKAYGFGI